MSHTQRISSFRTFKHYHVCLEPATRIWQNSVRDQVSALCTPYLNRTLSTEARKEKSRYITLFFLKISKNDTDMVESWLKIVAQLTLGTVWHSINSRVAGQHLDRSCDSTAQYCLCRLVMCKFLYWSKGNRKFKMQTSLKSFLDHSHFTNIWNAKMLDPCLVGPPSLWNWLPENAKTESSKLRERRAQR